MAFFKCAKSFELEDSEVSSDAASLKALAALACFMTLVAGVDVKKCTVMQEMGIMPAMAQEGIDTLEALERMLETQSTVVPLLEGESFVGVVDMFTIIAGVINDHPVDNEEIFIDMISGNNHFLLLRDLITSASVADLINASPEPPTLVTINAKDSVHSLAELMFRERVSSALVLDTSTSTQMSGVVSTTDLTLRVMATGMDPKSTTVVRVMTPAPACVYPDSDCLTVLQRLIGKDDKKESTSSSLLSVREAVVPVINFDGSMVALLDLPAVVKMLMLCFKQMIMQDDKDNEFGEDYQIQLNDHELDEDETCLSSLISPSEQAEKNVVQKVLTKQFEIPTSQQSLAATCIIRVMVERDDGEYHHHLFEWSQEAKNLFWTELEAKIPNWACLVDQANHIKIINHCRWENSKTAKERCYDNPGAGQLDNSTNNGKNEDTIASYISVSPEEWIPNTPVTTFLVQVAKIVALSIDEKEPICFTVEPVSNSNQSIKSLSSPPFPVSPPSQSAPITNSFSETLLISLNSSIQTMPIATMNDEISNKVQIELSNSQSPSKGKKKSDVSNRNSGAGSFSSIGNGMPRRTPSSELTLLNEAGLAIDAKNKNASFFNSSSITSTIKSFFLPSVDYNSDNSSMVEEKGKVSAKTQSGGSAETKRYRLLMAGIGAAAGTALLATAIGLVYFMRSKNHQSQ